MTTTASFAVPVLVASLFAVGDLAAHASAPRTLPDLVVELDAALRRLPCVVRVDLGAYEGVALRQIAVQKGDTFSSIAKRRLGDAARASEIAARNPDVDPTKLKVGSWLWLPLAKATPKATTVYAAFVHNALGMLEPMRAADATGAVQNTAAGVVLVPIDQMAAILQTPQLPTDPAKAGLVVAPMHGGLACVPKHSPAHRLVLTYALVTKDGASTMQLANEQFLDADGKPIDRAAALQPAPAPKQGAAWLLAGMALGGGLLARRGRRA